MDARATPTSPSWSPPLAAGCLAAATVLHHSTQLPDTETIGCLWAITGLLVCTAVLLQFRRSRLSFFLAPFAVLMAAACATATLATHDAREWLNNVLPPACEGQPLALTVRIVDLPTRIDGQGRVTVEVLEARGCSIRGLSVSLGWTSGQAKHPKQPVTTALDWNPAPGEIWTLQANLKRPIATLNFGGFDVHHLWMQRGIGALGNVMPPPRGPRPSQINSDAEALTLAHTIERWRQTLARRIDSALPPDNHPFNGILQGLAIGHQKPITPDQWNVLSATGTSHLVSISGMHVTLLAGWLAWLVTKAWLRIPALAMRLPARYAAAAVSLPTAALYAGLAGWGIPAQRTVASLALGTAVLLLRKTARPLDLLCLACALVTLANPWSANSPGFLLSFGAVGILIFSSAGRVRHAPVRWPRLHRLCSEHLTVFIGLMPLSVALFGQFSWISPLANAVAIAWMSFVTTPLILTGSLLDATWLMQAAHLSLTPLWPLLSMLANLPLAWQPVAAPPAFITLLSVLGGLLALMPSGLGLRLPGLLLISLPFLWPVNTPQTGDFEVTVLDIGQGNSIAIRTARHIMLVDAGNATGPRQDQGRLVVLPWLYQQGRRHWDAVLVSHNDSDHSGGMASVIRTSRVDWLLANPPFAPAATDLHRIGRQTPCLAGRQWEWDGVHFQVLYPTSEDLQSTDEDNAMSCVLKVSSPAGSVLLPGDIGVEQEERLIERFGGSPHNMRVHHAHPTLQSDLVLVPHHGSTTSSSTEFIEHTRARWAVFQIGFRNRYGHPSPDIWSRWQAAGAIPLRSDQTGAIRFRFSTRHGLSVATARTERKRFWHLDPRPSDNPQTRKSGRKQPQTHHDSANFSENRQTQPEE